jgi:hypothetical protein
VLVKENCTSEKLFLSKIKPSNIGKAVSGLVYGAGLGFYKTINKGIGDTVGFGDEALCWLKTGT